MARLRTAAPVVRQRSTGVLLVATHASVTGVLRDRTWGRVWSDRTHVARLAPFNDLHRHQMMENEPPAHTRLRRSVAAAFGRGHVERLRPRVRTLAAGLLDGCGSELDVVRNYAEPLSVAVICELLGVPVASVVLLLNAGHEASVNGFGNAVHTLAQHPAELAALASGRVGVETAWEELLRFDTPLQLFERTAMADTVVAGVGVPAGTRVALLMGAANRDPDRFDDPDRLDLSRDASGHVTFGLGVHFCLGAPLARMELQVALRALLNRAPRLRVVGGERRPGFVLRGWASLPVQLDG